jgi:hypothetical protein
MTVSSSPVIVKDCCNLSLMDGIEIMHKIHERGA